MWFENLFGFEEQDPQQVRDNIRLEGQQLTSLINGKSFQFGELEIPSLEKFRNNINLANNKGDKLKLTESVGNVQAFHSDPENKGALFQAASQFNLLEMVNPRITPEDGIDRYENDYTQGPACAIACGAGTLYRNYFANIKGQIGQTSSNQIDCIDDIGKFLGNEQNGLWKMSNGYALCNENGLLLINKLIAQLSKESREELKGKLKVGIQWNTEVTLDNFGQIVNQIYCSALPVSYSEMEFFYWESFARVILEATYEATLYTGLLNYQKTGNKKVFLTLVGGGAFGNELKWILDSIELALNKFMNTPLEVSIVSYGKSNQDVQNLISNIKW